MTEADNETIDDSGVLPQANSFSMYVVNKYETNITNINTEEYTNDDYYTLNGIKVNKLSKGIYIRNNKKVVIK